MRDIKDSLKHIFIIFKFKQSLEVEKKKRVVNGVCGKNMLRYERYHDGLWVFLFKRCATYYLFYDVFLLQVFSPTPSSGCRHPLFCLPLQHTLQRHSLHLAFGIKLTAIAFLSTIVVMLVILLVTFAVRNFCSQHFFKFSFLLLSRS